MKHDNQLKTHSCNFELKNFGQREAKFVSFRKKIMLSKIDVFYNGEIKLLVISIFTICEVMKISDES